MSRKISTGFFTLSLYPIAAMGQTPLIDQSTFNQAQAALKAAEEASREAKASATAATKAAATADAQLREAHRLMAALTTGAPVPVPVKTRAIEDPAVVAACPDVNANLTTVEYFTSVNACERRVLVGSKVNGFKSKTATGFGTSIAAGSSGASATITLESVNPYRSIFNGVPFRGSADVLQQRVKRQRYAVGLRADVGKDDNKFASIATFGELDRLASKVAVFGRYGWDYSTAEEFKYRPGAKSDFIQKRAEELAPKLVADCLKALGATCSGIDLVRWLFEAKTEPGAEKEFANPAAIKLYNEVFWGPPAVDPRPAYGWSIRGELSRPKFDYYPFGLTKVADPLKPGDGKTVIDPALFPTDFASRIVKNEDHLNFALTARAFWHLSRFRANNLITRRAKSFSTFAERTSGTTFIGTVSYVRADEIEKPFRDVKVCAPPSPGRPFVTDQTCSTLNIAKPVRKNSPVLGGEIRQGIDPFWIVPPMLVSARLTHDFSSNENGLAVPLFFGTDLTGTFTSGLRVSHQWGGNNADGSNKKSETLVGVVFGVSLGLDGTTGID